MFSDIIASIRNHQYWTYSVWLKFGLTYRKTSLGPFWLVVSPAVFIGFLGYLFSYVNKKPIEVFIPHLSVGYITWVFISGILNAAPTLFVRRRSELLQGQMRLTDIVFSDIFQGLLTYLHQMLVVVAVFLWFSISLTPAAILSLIGLGLIILNAVWVYLVLGTLGARYRDLVEMLTAIVRLGFFITPIIWIPENGQGGVLGAFLILNPFYHFLELVRAPLLGQPIAMINWIVVISITLLGFLFAEILYRRVSRFVPLWV
jgi:ABC-2 type transport system permease protein/lipopolysaccharide transport system permease protein